MKFITSFILLILVKTICYSQSLLQKKVTVQVVGKPLKLVFKSVEEQGGFYFSYNSNLIKGDSTVSLHHKNSSVEQLLKTLFGTRFQYKESDKYIAIVPATVQQQVWYVSGYVNDFTTGQPISNATVFERLHLASAMTDEKGYFRLQLREQPSVVDINISKISYADTVIQISSAASQNISVSITPVSYELDSVVIGSGRIESRWLARMLISSRQQMNSLNLGGFISQQPFQFSLTPGLGTHGRMGSQVIDRFSMNIIGGYTAGIDGFELGSIFNIVKQDVRYVQVGGVFNMVGGNVQGVQLGGAYNQVLGKVKGIQVGGIANMTLGSMHGIQLGGIYNQSLNAAGIQVAGLANINRKGGSGIQLAGIFNYAQKSDGLQIAGLVNSSQQELKGIQIAGVVNQTKHLKGLQIGLINIADTSDGYSLGLINIIKRGYHKIAISTTDLHGVNIAFKTGNERLYSILIASASLNMNKKSFSAGYGIGSTFHIKPKYSFNPELSTHWIYAGDIDNTDYVTRAQFQIRYQLSHNVALFAGPAFSFYYHNEKTAVNGYRQDARNGMPGVDFSNRFKGWIGWSAGLDLF